MCLWEEVVIDNPQNFPTGKKITSILMLCLSYNIIFMTFVTLPFVIFYRSPDRHRNRTDRRLWWRREKGREELFWNYLLPKKDSRWLFFIRKKMTRYLPNLSGNLRSQDIKSSSYHRQPLMEFDISGCSRRSYPSLLPGSNIAFLCHSTSLLFSCHSSFVAIIHQIFPFCRRKLVVTNFFFVAVVIDFFSDPMFGTVYSVAFLPSLLPPLLST